MLKDYKNSKRIMLHVVGALKVERKGGVRLRVYEKVSKPAS